MFSSLRLRLLLLLLGALLLSGHGAAGSPNWFSLLLSAANPTSDAQPLNSSSKRVSLTAVELQNDEKSHTIVSGKQKLLPRLELLHIQKNAGSLFEVMAMNANISWGTCHFDFPWRRNSPFKMCPPLREQRVVRQQVWWHYPLQYLKQVKYPHGLDPYDNLQNATYVARPKKFFVVVRNPYDRLISMFYHSHRNSPRLTHGPNAKLYLNTWSRNVLRDGNHVGLAWKKNSTICQHQYLFDEITGKSVPNVDHVVQFEYLVQDFHPLAKQYGLGNVLEIPARKENFRPRKVSDFGMSDLDTKTTHLMNTICSKDFDLARGYKKIH